MDLLHREKGLRRALKAVVSWDIVSKLKGQRLLFQKGLIDGDAEAWTKRRTEQSQHRYAAILQNCLSHPAYMNNRKEELKKLRMMHHIDDEHHKQALERHGWKVEEFERGYKDGQELPELDADLNHDWKWHATNVFMKIFG